MHFDASFFVAVGFVLFVLMLGYFGVHTMLAKTLDDRATLIADELSEASRLRNEAEAVLASYQRKAAEAQSEADAILTSAREEAEALAAETAKRMSEFVARRTQQAEAKIAIAESQAMNEVRAAAADAAVKAAETILRAQMKDGASADMLTASIKDVRKGFAH
jgi:F-type H+-transporting ATPase subunit b